jgi:hypothetical protein
MTVADATQKEMLHLLKTEGLIALKLQIPGFDRTPPGIIEEGEKTLTQERKNILGIQYQLSSS